MLPHISRRDGIGREDLGEGERRPLEELGRDVIEEMIDQFWRETVEEGNGNGRGGWCGYEGGGKGGILHGLKEGKHRWRRDNETREEEEDKDKTGKEMSGSTINNCMHPTFTRDLLACRGQAEVGKAEAKAKAKSKSKSKSESHGMESGEHSYSTPPPNVNPRKVAQETSETSG